MAFTMLTGMLVMALVSSWAYTLAVVLWRVRPMILERRPHRVGRRRELEARRKLFANRRRSCLMQQWEAGPRSGTWAAPPRWGSYGLAFALIALELVPCSSVGRDTTRRPLRWRRAVARIEQA